MKKFLSPSTNRMMRRERYTAYKLLAPTLFVLFLVAVYPLGSAFVKRRMWMARHDGGNSGRSRYPC